MLIRLFPYVPPFVLLLGVEFPDILWPTMMNFMLRDMETELHQGDSFADPKFLVGQSLKKFDAVIANPMCGDFSNGSKWPCHVLAVRRLPLSEKPRKDKEKIAALL